MWLCTCSCAGGIVWALCCRLCTGGRAWTVLWGVVLQCKGAVMWHSAVWAYVTVWHRACLGLVWFALWLCGSRHGSGRSSKRHVVQSQPWHLDWYPPATGRDWTWLVAQEQAVVTAGAVSCP
eukprot:jgi/Mesvir1/2770/Mv25279-RA.1